MTLPFSRLALCAGLLLALAGCKKDNNDTPAPGPPAQTRTYYIASEEGVWDYVSEARNVFLGRPFNKMDSVFAVNIPSGPTPRIGRRYLKARFVEYTDASFSTPKAVQPEWTHLGILGPVIRAVVGDSVHVVLKNRTSITTSIHVHGLLYGKASEGSMNSSTDSNGIVQPGGTHLYRFFARERSGPGPNEGSSAVWVYHSGVNNTQTDLNAGMVGAIVVTRRDKANADATPNDVDREIVTLYNIFDENLSPYLPRNLATYLPGVPKPMTDDFMMSNKMHSINGYIMGSHNAGLTMKKGQRVRWYVMGFGDVQGVHTAHWHGNVSIMSQRTTDVIEILPAVAVVADMVPDDVGQWAYHCHVSNHAAAGMDTFYTVTP
ncbi:multicopper oxidase domain-containing protein [Hymenobacter sp. UYCo722]|uniref:multicopper oxidase domain-containing protein n=1 Tax=Hymenobacter sp. UYCo722 TaxID=3156335 RepID=UPI00339A317B